MEINGKQFNSKAALDKYVSQILNSHEPGDGLCGEEERFIVALIHNHPKSDDKIGVGIKGILVKTDPVWKRNKQFWIVRQDGTTIDFSFKKCIFGETSKIDLIRHACRTAVADDIIKFKMAALQNNPCCPFRKRRLTKTNSAVDHVYPLTFNALVDFFVEGKGLDINYVDVIGEIQKRFKNPEIAEAFRTYHSTVAELELVSQEANNDECKKRLKR